MLAAKQSCAFSNGSACNSNSYEPSYVLRAMGISDDTIECSVRISWGSNTSSTMLREAFSELCDIVKQMS